MTDITKSNRIQTGIWRELRMTSLIGAMLISLSPIFSVVSEAQVAQANETVPQRTEKVGLTQSLVAAAKFDDFGGNDDRRSFHSEIRYLETMLSYGPVSDPRPIFLLANAYIVASQQDYGIRFFEQVLEHHNTQFQPEVRAVYLAAYALLRATYADEIWLFNRIGWILETFRILERADRISGGSNPLVKWSSGMVYARVPGFFFKHDAAIRELTWLAEHPETEPTPGFFREAYRHLAELQKTEGNDDIASKFAAQSGYLGKPPSVLFSGWFASTFEKGLRFAPTPSIEQVVHGRVFAVRGFGFSDLQFVKSKDGQHLISIDAGTQPFSMESGLAFLRKAYPNLPPLTHVLITHAHWDHIGGHTYLRKLDSKPIFYGRGNFHGTLNRVQRTHRYKQFRSVDWKDEWVSNYKPDVVINEQKQISVGGSKIQLIPTTGGETEDALLIHFPDLKVTFMGDALMPFYGEPWVEEGFIDEALLTMDKVIKLSPKHILHGHYGITILYNPTQLSVFRNAYAWLVNATRLHITNGFAAEDIIRLNLIPPTLHTHPESFLSYLAARDTLIARVADKMTGIWQEDRTGQEPRGLDILSSVEYGRLLTSYLDLSQSDIEAGLHRMLKGGDNTLALKMAVAALHQHPQNVSFLELRNQAADRLRSAAQFFDPFRFVVYTELRGTEHPSIPLLYDMQTPR